MTLFLNSQFELHIDAIFSLTEIYHTIMLNINLLSDGHVYCQNKTCYLDGINNSI